MRTAIDTDDATLIAKYRTPLDTKRALSLAAMVTEYPEHVVSVEGIWLVLRFPEGGAA